MGRAVEVALGPDEGGGARVLVGALASHGKVERTSYQAWLPCSPALGRDLAAAVLADLLDEPRGVQA